MKKTIKFLSLFSGCGGFDAGFENCGYECVGAIDNNELVLNVYSNNLKGPVFLHDLSNHELPNSLRTSKIDVLVAGSPCQGFSTAGLRKIEDPRNSLLLVSGSIAKKLNPQVIISENVMGSISDTHRIYWDTLIVDLKEQGYNIDFLKLSATDFGLSQLRKRVFMIAWKGKSKLSVSLDKTEKKSLREILNNIDHVPNQDTYYPIKDSITEKLINYIKPGQKLCNVRGGVSSVHTWDIPEVYGTVTEVERQILYQIKDLRRKIRLRKNGDSDPLLLEDLQAKFEFDIESHLISLIEKKFVKKVLNRYDFVHTFNGLYKRVHYDKDSMTVDTRFGNPRYFLHPSENRGFTVREAARIQGFKDSFIFQGSIEQQFRMIGNAVPPPMAKGLAEMIKKNFFV